MRNYVIINGVNSLTIQGLAINIMPPISKPPMRTLREEIDGRDGDITTELGYGAYDRTLEVGLYGNYDIDEVIAFFNSKGTIVFSDEDDKYYNFEITDRIDYTKLVKFRTASINFHCQPFKYPLNETPLEEEYEYVEGEGTELTLNDTANAIFNKFDLKGNTSQASTPTPSSPIPVNVVSGDNIIDICGKNLVGTTDVNTTTTNGITYSVSNGIITINGTATANTTIMTTTNFNLNENTTYNLSFTTISGTKDSTFMGLRFRRNGSQVAFIQTNSTTSKNMDLTNINDIQLYILSGTTFNNYSFSYQLEVGSTATTYEPYIGNTYPIYLGVENLINNMRTTTTINGLTFTVNSDGSVLVNGTVTADTSFITCDQTQTNIRNKLLNKTLTLSGCPSGGSSSTYRLQIWGTGTGTFYDYGSGSTFSFTNSSSNWNVAIYITSGQTINNLLFKPMVEEGSKSNHYTPYGTTPTELCKIGTYQDYIYKDNGSWYLHKEIGKVVLNGANITLANTYSNLQYVRYNKPSNFIGNSNYNYYEVMSNKCISQQPSTLNSEDMIGKITPTASTSFWWIGYALGKQLEDIQSELDGAIIYYPLATPTNTLIEDTTLIEQLEALKLANSYATQTNISQTNNDAPFILDLSALKENSDHLVIDNIGNIYSKPTLDLEGTGIVDIYLNDTQMFEVDLSEKNEIVIDTEKMEAYNPTDNTLANRQVTGDYSKFKLDSGENDLRFSGDLTKATITRYERWL